VTAGDGFLLGLVAGAWLGGFGLLAHGLWIRRRDRGLLERMRRSHSCWPG